ncbi:hypothetical protein [Micromonospora sp. NPDC023633]|uniref:hypothetical protein n=1 Tax=Micromonospora sp. NPDC023633 TaxID=3154320 RepID=UPI0033E1AFA0
MLSDLATAWPMLTLIGLGAGAVAYAGRDTGDHDLSDYHAPAAQPAPPIVGRVPGAWAAVDRKPMPPRRAARRRRAELVESIVPTLSDAAVRGIAAEWLRELGEQARAGLAAAR